MSTGGPSVCHVPWTTSKLGDSLGSGMAASPIAADFERLLASEGLAPLDASSPSASSNNAHGPEEAEAVDAYLAWARSVLETHAFGGARERQIWEMHADAKTHTEIQLALRVPRRAVTRAVDAVKASAPPAPVANPWRRSGRPPTPPVDGKLVAASVQADQRVTTRLFMIALACVPDRARFAALVATDNELTRLVPQGARIIMAEAKGKPVTLHYRRILLRHPLDVGQGAVRKQYLPNVEGRPHAGGIDVVLDKLTITVPWWNIKQADRDVPEEAA